MPPAPACRRLLGEVTQVRHHVVPGLALELGDPLEVERRRGLAQGLRSASRVIGRPSSASRLGEHDPQPAPGRDSDGRLRRARAISREA